MSCRKDIRDGDLCNRAKLGRSFASVCWVWQSFLVVEPTRLTLGFGLKQQGEYDKAYPLYQRALRMNEQILGPDNPDVATDLNNLATLLEKQVGFRRNLTANLCYGSSNRSYRTGVVEASVCPTRACHVLFCAR